MKNKSKTWMWILAVIVVVIGIVTFCKTNQTPQEQSREVSAKGCYVAKLAKDVYVLDIQSEENGNITGMLAFNNSEKDSSSGSFNGRISNDLLIGNYSFDSEGMHSDRQVVFKKEGDNFVEGFGPTKTVDNQEIIDLASIKYDPNSTFVKSENCTEQFIDSNKVFSFNYNPFFQVFEPQSTLSKEWKMNAEQNGALLTKVIFPKAIMPGTNFSEASLSVGRSSDVKSIKTCTNSSGGESLVGAQKIGGYSFSKFTLSDAGAGNFYNTTSYRGTVDGNCYAIEYTIHSTNIGNYSPDQGVEEFNKAVIQNEMDKILASFKFLVSSN